MKKVFAFVCAGIILATACKKDRQKNLSDRSVAMGSVAMQHNVTFNRYTDTTTVEIKLVGANGKTLSNPATYADKITVGGQQLVWSEALEAFVIKRKGLEPVKIEFKGDKEKELSWLYDAAEDQYLTVSPHDVLSLNKDYEFSWTGRQLESNEKVQVDIKQENRKLKYFSLFTTVGRGPDNTKLPVSLATYNRRLDKLSRFRVSREGARSEEEKIMEILFKSLQTVSGDPIVPGPATLFFSRKRSNSSLQQKDDGVTYSLSIVTGKDIKVSENGQAVVDENKQ